MTGAEFDILSAIGSVGFPIVAACGIFYLYDKTIKEITQTLIKVNSTLEVIAHKLDIDFSDDSEG